MKNLILILTGMACLILALSGCPSAVDPVASASGELIANGDFSAGSANWQTGTTEGATANFSFSGGHMQLTASTGSLTIWNIYAGQNNLNLQKNSLYRLSFDAASTVATDNINVILNSNIAGKDFARFDLTLGTPATHYEVQLATPDTDGPSGSFYFSIGNTTGVITIDNVSLIRTGAYVPDPDTEMVKNGNFNAGENFWDYWVDTDTSPGSKKVGSFSGGEFKSAASGSGSFDQLKSINKHFINGKNYTISFKAKSANSSGDSILVLVQENGTDYNNDGSKYSALQSSPFSLTDVYQTFTFNYNSLYTTTDAVLSFGVGNPAGTRNISIDDVSMTLN